MSGFPVAAPSVLPSATFAGPGLPFFGGGGGPSGGSSITGGGATVACDDPVSSGSIAIVGSQSPGVAGNINIITKSTVGGSINLDTIQTGGDIHLSTGEAGNKVGRIFLDTHLSTDANAGLIFNTAQTLSLFGGGGTPSIIKLQSLDTTNPGQVSVGGVVNNTGLYVSNSQLLFNGTAVGSTASSSSITAGGATVACDSPGTSGAIRLTTNNTGSDGSIYLVSSAATVGAIVGQGQDVGLAANSGGSGVAVKSPACAITLDANQLGQPIAGGANFPTGVDSQIVLSTSSTNAATVSIGGAVNNTGLYVSNSQLLYNGASFAPTAAPADGTPAAPVALTAAYTLSGNKAWFSIASATGPFIISPPAAFTQAVPISVLITDGSDLTSVINPDRTVTVTSSSMGEIKFVVVFA